MDEEIDDVLADLKKIFYPEPLERLKQHIGRLYQKIEELEESRDKWKAKALTKKDSEI